MELFSIRIQRTFQLVSTHRGSHTGMSVRHPAEINGKGFQRRDQPVGCYGGQQVLHLLHILRRGSAGCLQGGRYHAGNGGSSGF